MTTLLNGYEPAVLALHDRLTGSLNTYVDAVNDQSADTTLVDHVDVANILTYIPPLDLVRVFPTVGIGRLPGRLEDDLSHSATGVYRFSVLWFLQDANQDVLVKKADRMLRAVVSCVLEGRAWGEGPGTPWPGSVTVRDIIPGDALGDRPSRNDPPKSYLTWGGIVVQAKFDEP